MEAYWRSMRGADPSIEVFGERGQVEGMDIGGKMRGERKRRTVAIKSRNINITCVGVSKTWTAMIYNVRRQIHSASRMHFPRPAVFSEPQIKVSSSKEVFQDSSKQINSGGDQQRQERQLSQMGQLKNIFLMCFRSARSYEWTGLRTSGIPCSGKPHHAWHGSGKASAPADRIDLTGTGTLNASD